MYQYVSYYTIIIVLLLCKSIYTTLRVGLILIKRQKDNDKNGLNRICYFEQEFLCLYKIDWLYGQIDFVLTLTACPATLHTTTTPLVKI